MEGAGVLREVLGESASSAVQSCARVRRAKKQQPGTCLIAFREVAAKLCETL